MLYSRILREPRMRLLGLELQGREYILLAVFD